MICLSTGADDSINEAFPVLFMTASFGFQGLYMVLSTVFLGKGAFEAGSFNLRFLGEGFERVFCRAAQFEEGWNGRFVDSSIDIFPLPVTEVAIIPQKSKHRNLIQRFKKFEVLNLGYGKFLNIQSIFDPCQRWFKQLSWLLFDQYNEYAADCQISHHCVPCRVPMAFYGPWIFGQSSIVLNLRHRQNLNVTNDHGSLKRTRRSFITKNIMIKISL